MTDRRERIAALIRALSAKTVENGCTEGEAISAAEKLAALLAEHNMTIDEAELRASPFQQHRKVYNDWVGERLWKIADGIAHMTGVRYWANRAGEKPSIDFFGFAHEVEIAAYLLTICREAMLREQQRIVREKFRGSFWPTSDRQRRAIVSFLDGMADRLRQRLRDLKPPEPTGKGLVVLRGALIEAAMPIKPETRSARNSRDLDDGYLDGVAAGERVPLNRAVGGGETATRRLS